MDPWVLPVCLGVLFALFASLLVRCHRRCCLRRRCLPNPTDDSVIHAEDGASGYSHRNLVTKVGGARRCVKIVVTRDGLVVDLAMPLALFAEQVDLCHRIAFSAIERVTEQHKPFGTECVITYRTPDGGHRRLSVFPEAPDQFLKVLKRNATVAA
jgi:hypothetical protein